MDLELAVQVVVARHRTARPTESQRCEDKVGADWNGNSTVPPAPAIEFPTGGETTGISTRSDIRKRKAAADRHRARAVVERAVAELAVVAVAPAIAITRCTDPTREVIAGRHGLERDAALHTQGRETAWRRKIGIARGRRGVRAELAGGVRAPAIRVAAGRHAAAVFPDARRDVVELQAAGDENWPVATASTSAPARVRHRIATELAAPVASPAVRIAVAGDRAGVAATGLDTREQMTAGDGDGRQHSRFRRIIGRPISELTRRSVAPAEGMAARVERTRVPIRRRKPKAESTRQRERSEASGSRAVANPTVGVQSPAVGVPGDTHSTDVAATNADGAEAEDRDRRAVAPLTSHRLDPRGPVMACGDDVIIDHIGANCCDVADGGVRELHRHLAGGIVVPIPTRCAHAHGVTDRTEDGGAWRDRRPNRRPGPRGGDDEYRRQSTHQDDRRLNPRDRPQRPASARLTL